MNFCPIKLKPWHVPSLESFLFNRREKFAVVCHVLNITNSKVLLCRHLSDMNNRGGSISANFHSNNHTACSSIGIEHERTIQTRFLLFLYMRFVSFCFWSQLMASGLSGAYSEVVHRLVGEVLNTDIENAIILPLPVEAKTAKGHRFNPLPAIPRDVQVSGLYFLKHKIH